MTEILRKIKLITHQAILAAPLDIARAMLPHYYAVYMLMGLMRLRLHYRTDVPHASEGYPMREWSIKVVMLNSDGDEVPASVFDRVTYKLHPTFANPSRTLKKPPFLLQEQGWGEFDMNLVLHAIDKGGDHLISHDLNFQKTKYESVHTLTFVNPRPNLLKQLALSGPVTSGRDENGFLPTPASKRDKRKNDGEERSKKKTRLSDKGHFDMDRLADGLQKLDEEDLLKVVQMVHDNKTTETYVKNDVEHGEFHVDLYTLPEHLTRMLWRFVQDRVSV